MCLRFQCCTEIDGLRASFVRFGYKCDIIEDQEQAHLVQWCQLDENSAFKRCTYRNMTSVLRSIIFQHTMCSMDRAVYRCCNSAMPRGTCCDYIAYTSHGPPSGSVLDSNNCFDMPLSRNRSIYFVRSHSDPSKGCCA